jgi:hypothetical protein
MIYIMKTHLGFQAPEASDCYKKFYADGTKEIGGGAFREWHYVFAAPTLTIDIPQIKKIP